VAESMNLRPERWTLTQEALDLFLARLDPDRDRAGQIYEQIRHKLVTFFRCNGFWDGEDLVDETLDRVIRRHAEVEIIDLMAFIRGVARRVASESHKLQVRQIPLDDAPELVRKDNTVNDPEETAIAEKRLICLEQCASRLHKADRDLVGEYYRYKGRQKIENKRKMAEAMGITPGTLRVRAFRVRLQLEGCMTQCMGGGVTS